MAFIRDYEQARIANLEGYLNSAYYPDALL